MRLLASVSFHLRRASLHVRAMTYVYPRIRRDESLVEQLHGQSVADPYRWLENPDAADTVKFVEEQSKITDNYLLSFPHKKQYNERLTALWNYEKFGTPKNRGGAYFFSYNSGLQQQSIWYKQTTLNVEPSVFFDPNKLSDDGTVALGTFAFSESGSHFAYALSKSGSDWQTIHIKKCDDATDLNDKLEHVKFSSISWTKKDEGFFYLRYPAPSDVKNTDLGTETGANLNAQLYYHCLQTPQEKDILVYCDPANPTYMFGAEVTDCGRYIVLSIQKDCDPVNKLYIAQLPLTSTSEKNTMVDVYTLPNLDWTEVIDSWDAGYDYITNNEGIFYFKTNLNAPRYRLVKFDFTTYNKVKSSTSNPTFIDILPQHTTDVMQWASCVDKDKLIVAYMHDVKSQLSLHQLATGQLITDIPMPEIGNLTGLSTRKSLSEFFFAFESFLSPGTIYRYDCADTYPMAVVFKQPRLDGFDRSQFITKQEFYVSKDGTKIPIFLLHHKDIKLNTPNPVFLYGYGGFSISICPTFSPNLITFANHLRGVVAIANIRGGGEYGEDWHKAGMLHNKQNVFDDFQYAAKYLVSKGYTTTHQKVAINGGSNGGLLVGACINQAPELFGCAVAEVGVMDMLRFHKFTIGHAWCSDYGSPDNKGDFEYLIRYSPYHTIKTQNYPPTMLVTSDHDDRVVPLHSYKYVAALQYANSAHKYPLLIRIETKAGHGAGMPTSKRIHNLTEKMSFVGLSLGCQWHE